MNEYHQNTFEPIEDTQPESPQVETTSQPDPEIDSQVQTDTPEVTQQEPVKKDNDAVRYEYWQSEATKTKRELEEMRKQIAELKPKEPSKEDAPPEMPSDLSDPIAMLEYNRKLIEYNNKRLDKIETARQQEIEQRQQEAERLAVRNFTIAKLTEVNKNPQKSQNIVDFFANSEHLKNPVVYDVMYDAAMNFINGKKPQVQTQLKTPPPPTGGGNVAVGKTTPDDAFNEQTMKTGKSYRL